jgi:cytochrome c biogenesis protein CcdA/thiol-disulfide isomerase/thioredoxin
MLEIFLALIAGVLTIAAPCILLPLPILLGSSVGQTSKTRPLFITLGFVLTFSILGITLNAIVQNLGVDPNILRTVAVILLAVFAVFMIWPTPFERLTQHLSGLINRVSQTGQQAGSGNWGGFVMGIVIGIVWAPCAGPILASILTLIAQEKELTKAFGLLIAYSVGAGLPMLAIAYGGQAVTTKVRWIARYSTRLQQVFGVILLFLAIAIYYQYDTKLQAWLVERLPTLNSNLEDRIINTIDDKSSETQNAPSTPNAIELKNYGQAPEFTGIANWLNSNPLTMTELRGKVVLVDFWTYSCINCVRTLPYITKWYDTYKDQGLVVVGVHTPEFAFEKSTDNVRRAIDQHNIHYPVAQDNDFGTWRAYSNRYWPAKYLIDKDGRIVYTHFGEGAYEETEIIIRQLLGTPSPLPLGEGQGESHKRPQTPEIYFGTERLEYFDSSIKPTDVPQTYSIPTGLQQHHFGLAGTWKFDEEHATLTKGPGTIKLNFLGSKIFMVASSEQGQQISVRADGGAARTILVKDSSLYTLFDSENYNEHILEISIPEAGFEAYTFTFGS